jgi:hypothetical protein
MPQHIETLQQVRNQSPTTRELWRAYSLAGLFARRAVLSYPPSDNAEALCVAADAAFAAAQAAQEADDLRARLLATLAA